VSAGRRDDRRVLVFGALHFFDEQSEVRRNIVCVHNGMLVRARDMSEHRVQPGDELVLTNALAGG